METRQGDRLIETLALVVAFWRVHEEHGAPRHERGELTPQSDSPG